MKLVVAAIIAAALMAQSAFAQERFSIFVGSVQENVDRMIKLADVRDDGVVIDLGSGDGRIALTAAKVAGVSALSGRMDPLGSTGVHRYLRGPARTAQNEVAVIELEGLFDFLSQGT